MGLTNQERRVGGASWPEVLRLFLVAVSSKQQLGQGVEIVAGAVRPLEGRGGEGRAGEPRPQFLPLHLPNLGALWA